MVQSVLGSLVLGYRPLWNAARKLAGVQLYVHGQGAAMVDAPHLLRTIQELWSAGSPPLLLSPRSQPLLMDLLAHAPRGAPWIEVPGDWMALPAVRERAGQAHARGLRLVWSGVLDHLPDTETARLFDNSLLHLSGGDAVRALQAGAAAQRSPLIAGRWRTAWPRAAPWPWLAGPWRTCSTPCATSRSSPRTRWCRGCSRP